MTKASKLAATTGTAPATTSEAPAAADGGGRPRRSRKGLLEKVNAKTLALNQFARKWEGVFSDATRVDGVTDIVKGATKALAEQFSTLVAATDKASTLLETLKTNNWKAPKPRGKADHRSGDVVDMKKSKAAMFTKSGYKAADLVTFTVGKVAGSVIAVDNGKLSGTYPAAWFVRAAG